MKGFIIIYGKFIKAKDPQRMGGDRWRETVCKEFFKEVLRLCAKVILGLHLLLSE